MEPGCGFEKCAGSVCATSHRDAGVLTICETKFYKTRYIPLGHDLDQMLCRYLEQQWPGRPHGEDTPLLADWRCAAYCPVRRDHIPATTRGRLGKGGKTRRCPLWTATAKGLLVLVRDRSPDQRVFLNRLRQPLTRSGIHALLQTHVRKAALQCPSLLRKRISPHTIRHTTATHLLRSGVDINTIRAWMGHVSIDTTNIYAEVDLERKAQMLAQCASFEPETKQKVRWRDNPSLMSSLRSL